MKLVILESPYAGKTSEEIALNVAYARAALRDSLQRGEAPIASHLLYTQPGVLRDDMPTERRDGIKAGLAWGKVAEGTVVYTDLGISTGMNQGVDNALAAGRPVEYRQIRFKAPVVSSDGWHCGECHYLEPSGETTGGIAPTRCSLLHRELQFHDYYIAECGCPPETGQNV